MLNRSQRRAYAKAIKKNPAACICPECGYLTLFKTTHLDASESSNGKPGTAVMCTICDKIIRDGEEVTKLVPPGITLPLTLDKFDKAILWEAEHPSKPTKEEKNNDNSRMQSGDTETYRESSKIPEIHNG